jgi:hypothetical protein
VEFALNRMEVYSYIDASLCGGRAGLSVTGRFWKSAGDGLTNIPQRCLLCGEGRAGLFVTVRFWKSAEDGTCGFLTSMLSVWGEGRVYP